MLRNEVFCLKINYAVTTKSIKQTAFRPFGYIVSFSTTIRNRVARFRERANAASNSARRRCPLPISHQCDVTEIAIKPESSALRSNVPTPGRCFPHPRARVQPFFAGQPYNITPGRATTRRKRSKAHVRPSRLRRPLAPTKQFRSLFRISVTLIPVPGLGVFLSLYRSCQLPGVTTTLLSKFPRNEKRKKPTVH